MVRLLFRAQVSNIYFRGAASFTVALPPHGTAELCGAYVQIPCSIMIFFFCVYVKVYALDIHMWVCIYVCLTKLLLCGTHEISYRFD